MKYCDLNKLPYCDLRMGVIFYFFESPAKYRKEIKGIFEEYCELTEAHFTYYYKNEHAGFQPIKNDYRKYFYNFIDKKDFERTARILMTNATKEQMQSIKTEMILANIYPEYPGQIPNRMYFEFLPEIEFGKVLHFIKRTFQKIPCYYCCGSLVVGSNDQYIHKSASLAVQLFRETKCLSDKYSVFMNPSLEFEFKNNKISGSHFVQVLSPELCGIIGPDKITETCSKNKIHYEMEGDYAVIAISKDQYPAGDEEVLERYLVLNELFREIIFEMKKPRLYWKNEEWDRWMKRFDKKIHD